MTLRLKNSLILCITLVLCTSIIVVFLQSKYNGLPQLFSSVRKDDQTVSFPTLSTMRLSTTQTKILTITKNEYTLQPAGTKYAQGAKESWCADFVSWVYKEAEVPFSNPNSGSWRIPGTYTLRDYFETTHRFRPAGSSYTPKPGDVMLYDNPSVFGQHTNIVVSNENNTITTVGGNEAGKIRVQKQSSKESSGFVGYGVLPAPQA